MKVDRARLGRYGRAAARWSRLLVTRRSSEVSVFYGHDEIPAPGEPAAGGSAKFQKLHTRFPNDPTGFSLVYLGTTWLPRDLRPLLAYVRARRVPLVVNQDGVAYPGWAGDQTEALNAPLRRAVLAADHVLYQSAFSKRSADTFLGEPTGTWEILHNAVDVERFRPPEVAPEGPPVLLLGGDQTQHYRLELALRTLALVREQHPGTTMLVTGRLVSDPGPLVGQLGLEGALVLTGRYAQRDAPALFGGAHLLLHTKVNDPCPTAVIEAMACGLPVVHPASGGTVELVGDDGGIGVPHPDGWDRDEPPEPEALAAAVDRVLARREEYAIAARRRVVERFSLEPWLERHAEVFARLAGRPPGAQ